MILWVVALVCLALWLGVPWWIVLIACLAVVEFIAELAGGA